MPNIVKPRNAQEALLVNFAQAFAECNAAKMAPLFDDNIIVYITNNQAELDKIEGAKAFLARIQSVDYSNVGLQIKPTQLITLDTEKVMGMFHITAHKNQIDFENFAAFLGYTKNNKITHLWQLDAKPAYSDEFWKN
jgi:hypothetical protein